MNEYQTIDSETEVYRDGTIKLHGPDGFEGMRKAGRLAAEILDAMPELVKPGVTTTSIDDAVRGMMLDAGAVPATLGYRGYTHSCCISINHVICHGIPSEKTLKDGDIVNIDVTPLLDGWHGDSAFTFGVGAVIPVDDALSQATRESMEAGIAAMVPGNRLTDVSHAIEQGTRAAEKRHDRRFGIVAGYGGHGIGREMHMDPFLPNEGAPGRGLERRKARRAGQQLSRGQGMVRGLLRYRRYRD